ncbi:hypothetical protein POTOM_050539 [Populus tomentosa]|uniref:Uncharacterized protein n=1 Tax=Populus tomentosa TaxID=118781 RepID=A0A8X7YBY6_POPTO|nr:hypothetical protein POTOM_050539 [Populus tomentosa]
MASTGPEHELREDGEVFVFVGFVEFEEKVGNNFNLWQKNAFVYAADEVRESFDVYVFISLFTFYTLFGSTIWLPSLFDFSSLWVLVMIWSKFKEMNMCSGFGVDFERQIALLDGRCTVGRGSERNNNTI